MVIPAFNEAKLLPATLSSVCRAQQRLRDHGLESELIVVDNNSSDGTPVIAARYNARVLKCDAKSIGGVRNHGASQATGLVLLFLDADTTVPETTLIDLVVLLRSRPSIVGGSIATRLPPTKRILAPYLWVWRKVAKRLDLAQGIAQFFSRDGFNSLGGYDCSLVMAEDIEIYQRLKRHARERGKATVIIRENPVVPSARRLDAWPAWRTIAYQNPLICLALVVPGMRAILQSRRLWKAWYEETIR